MPGRVNQTIVHRYVTCAEAGAGGQPNPGATTAEDPSNPSSSTAKNPSNLFSSTAKNPSNPRENRGWGVLNADPEQAGRCPEQLAPAEFAAAQAEMVSSRMRAVKSF